jgi:hypothetical protein
MFNLELLMFHCVVWIGYSFLTDVQLITVDVPLCGVDRVFLLDVKKEYPIHTTQWNINSSELNSYQDGIPYPHHTMEHQQF